MKTEYPVSNISRLRMGTDGEGIRSLVLVSGCTLRCKLCINPAAWDGSREPRMMTASDIYQRILIDRLYILATNGGITFGGGEPLLYPDLIKEIRSICEPEMTLYVETALNVPWENVEKTLCSVDRYYVDIKTMNPEKYHEYTGGNLDVVKHNIARLVREKSADSVVVRIPEIPGLTDRNQQEKSKKELIDAGVRMFNLFKYREPKNTEKDFE